MRQLPDLSLIYDVLEWHKNSRDDDSSGGIFILLPRDLAQQFPEEGRLKGGNDSSPAHVTVLYIGQIIETKEEQIKELVQEVCSQFKPFKAKLGKPKKFDTSDRGKDYKAVRYSPVQSSKLKKIHKELKREFYRHHIPFDDKFPEFKAHCTIEYVMNDEKKPEYKDIKPEGEWIIDHIWIWGTEEPYMIYLGK